MWNSADLKTNAKRLMQNSYWPSVVVALILSLTVGNFSLNFNRNFSNYSNMNEGLFSESTYTTLGLIILPIFMLIFCFSLVLSIFVFHPLQVGCQHWFLYSRSDANYPIGNIGMVFKNGYMNIVKIMFCKQLFTALWSMLFLIPGIIKGYEYRMIPYLLAENPNMDMSEAFQRSKDMMYGEKMNAFLLDLSFIGWAFLSGLTCGLVGLFYVGPYQAYTNMELYVALCSGSRFNQNNSYGGYYY